MTKPRSTKKPSNVAKSVPSIFQLEPQEYGGPVARKGFHFQDHIAAGFCLQMLLNPTLSEVWCETIDDILLIWTNGTATEVEFVQVKSDELDQLWSIAMLCTGDSGPSSSILVKNLKHARCSEQCRFRIVTSRDIKKELSLLKTPSLSPSRDKTNPDFKALVSEARSKVGNVCSENGHKLEDWMQRVIWDVKGTMTHVEYANLHELQKTVESTSYNIQSDQLDELYARLLQKVKEAALADWKTEREAKKIKKQDLMDWLKQNVIEAIYPVAGSCVQKLRKKMEDAGLRDYIDTALDQRRRYLQMMYSPKYLEVEDKDLIVGEVQAELNKLKSELDSGTINDDGLAFHDRCIHALDDLPDNLFPQKLGSSFLQGCMYELTNRCVHRFSQPKL